MIIQIYLGIKKMPLITTIKAVFYAVLITFIVINGLKIYNTLNALQTPKIEFINKALK